MHNLPVFLATILILLSGPTKAAPLSPSAAAVWDSCETTLQKPVSSPTWSVICKNPCSGGCSVTPDLPGNLSCDCPSTLLPKCCNVAMSPAGQPIPYGYCFVPPTACEDDSGGDCVVDYQSWYVFPDFEKYGRAVRECIAQ